MVHTSRLMRLFLIFLLSVLFIPAFSTASSLEQCPLDTNGTIANSPLTWAQVLTLPILNFGQSSYIRPDIGRCCWSTRRNHELIRSRWGTYAVGLYRCHTGFTHTSGDHQSRSLGGGPDLVPYRGFLHGVGHSFSAFLSPFVALREFCDVYRQHML